MDIGHALAYSNIDLEKCIIELKDYIEYINLHFNDGRFDSHKVPSKKDLVNFKHIIEKADINHFICLEYTISNIDDEIIKVKKL